MRNLARAREGLATHKGHDQARERLLRQYAAIPPGSPIRLTKRTSNLFRNRLPHESVREMEILTGAGEIVVAGPVGKHSELFHAFPNSYGTLGYALRLV